MRFAGCATLLLVSSSAFAQSAPAAPAAAPTNAAPIVVKAVKQKEVCQSVTQLGSIIPKRVCRSAAEVAQDQARAETVLETARLTQQADTMARARIAEAHSGD